MRKHSCNGTKKLAPAGNFSARVGVTWRCVAIPSVVLLIGSQYRQLRSAFHLEKYIRPRTFDSTSMQIRCGPCVVNHELAL